MKEMTVDVLVSSNYTFIHCGYMVSFPNDLYM